MNKKQITILIVTTFSSLLTPFMGSAINVALPSIGSYFNSDIMTLNWVATGFLLSSSIFLLPAGRLADIYSLKLIFTIGISIFGIFSIASALSWNITSLIVFRVVQGIGGAMIFSTGVALLISFFPIQQRGRVLGINVASVY
ncbi:MAG TPA: MFS transporter, partial [Bacteroidales bacterium]|nr:MFS transporter [Bacteroidales bacterium]